MTDLKAPIAKKVEHKHIYHNKEYLDEYHWLRDDTRTKEEVLNFLKAENNYSKNLLEPLKDLKEDIFKELKIKLNEDDLSLPVKKGNYSYYSKNIKGLQYALNCRKKIGSEEEEIILDLNQFEEEYLDLGYVKIDETGTKLAYTLDTSGDEKYTIYIKDLTTGETKKELEEVNGYFAWSKDSKFLLFTRMDEILRPYQCYLHEIGKEGKDVLLFEEKDEKFSIDIGKTTSEKFLILDTSSSTSSESHFLDLTKPQEGFKCFSKRQEDRLYTIEDSGDDFLILTNRVGEDKFINFKLMKVAITNVNQKWETVLPYNEKVYLTDLYALKNYIILEERYGGLTQIRILNPNELDDEGYRLKFDEVNYAVEILPIHLNYEEDFIKYSYSSFLTSESIFEYDLKNKTHKLLKQIEVKEYDPSLYTQERLSCNGIPISLVYKTSLFNKNGENPLHLYGYGSYGINIEPDFRSTIFPLLDRGFVYAIAHIRGGAENGRAWYELEGKFKNKKNTFDNFCEAAKFLIEQKYTSSHLLSIQGASAGGLLMGAVLNKEPGLFNCIVSKVPFVDVINTMMDETIPLTINEYEEWGNPNEIDFFNYMLSYSPYDNLPKQPKNFPHILIRSGLNDPRVQYWEPAKYVAKIRDQILNQPIKPISKDEEDYNNRSISKLIHMVNLGSGHFGQTGRYSHLDDIAWDYAFVIASVKRLKPLN